MKKDYKFIKNRIKVAQIRAIGASVLGLMLIFGGIYIVTLFEKQNERIIGTIVIVALFLLVIYAIYTNIRAIKKYKSFLE